MLRFTCAEDSGDRKLFISNVYTESDWPVYFVIRLDYLENYGDPEIVKTVGRYYCSLDAVSWEAASEDARKGAVESCGHDIYDELDTIGRHILLLDYGTSARLWGNGGNNMRQLLREAHAQARECELFFGFRMDRPQNAIGADGWDWIAGNPIGRRLELKPSCGGNIERGSAKGYSTATGRP